MIPATATIAQQCGRIVAASGATTTPSERRRRLSVSVSSSLPSPRHGLCRLRAHAVSLCPPPPLRFFSPNNKERLLVFLVVLPPPPPPPAPSPPPPPLCSNPQLNTVCVMLYCASSARRSSTYIPSVCCGAPLKTTTRYSSRQMNKYIPFSPPFHLALSGGG